MVQMESLFEEVVVEWLWGLDEQVAVVDMGVMVQYLHLCMKKGGDVEKVLTVAAMELVVAKHQQGRQLVPNRPSFQQKRQQQVWQVVRLRYIFGQGLLGGVLVRSRSVIVCIVCFFNDLFKVVL